MINIEKCEYYVEDVFYGLHHEGCDRKATRKTTFANGTVKLFCGYCARKYPEKSPFVNRVETIK